MKIRQLVPAFLAISGIAFASLYNAAHTLTADSASEMISMANKKVLVGYWHN